MSTLAYRSRINDPYALSPTQLAQFANDGFIKLKNVFDAATLAHYGDAITRITLANNKLRDVPLEQRDTYGRAFIQVTNLWRKDEICHEFAFGKRLARIAAELLGVGGVRMWHDQALYKEAGGGFTPWHVDQQYWPMATDRCVTAWIPLQAVPIEMGPLAFGRGTHRIDIGRALAISDESEARIADAIRTHNINECFEQFDLGEVSFHLGWTLHRAGPNTTTTPRRVFTIIYMDADMRLAQPANENQRIDWEAFTPTTRVGEVMDDELNPVLYELP